MIAKDQLLGISEHTTHTVRVSQLRDYVIDTYLAAIDANDPALAHDVLCVLGPAGIGKSAAIQQARDSIAAGLVERGLIEDPKEFFWLDFRGTQRGPQDINGVMFPDWEQKRTQTLLPDEWPTEDRGQMYGIILYDEIFDSSRTVQAALYQALHDRIVGRQRLPEWIMQIAAGNGAGHGGMYQAPPMPLRTRLQYMQCSTSTMDVVEHFETVGAHPYVSAFLLGHPEATWAVDYDSADFAQATPRGWERVSRVTQLHSKTPERMLVAASGCVGQKWGGQYAAFVQRLESGDFVSPMAILRGDDPAQLGCSSDLSSRFASCAAAVRHADETTVGHLAAYIRHWHRENKSDPRTGIEKDFAVAICRLIAQRPTIRDTRDTVALLAEFSHSA